MPTHAFEPPRGRLLQWTVDSRALRGNGLGDPSRRTVAVYLTPGYDEAGAGCPLFVDLAGFTGSGLKRLAWTGFGESVPQRLDRLVAEGKLGPVAVAFPDCFTSLGGNQYINSAVMGAWEDFLLEELVPKLEHELNVLHGARHRAVYGKSSGGYGALIQALRHGEAWGAIAAHSPDVDFELVYRREFPAVLDALARAGGLEAFMGRFRDAPKVRGADLHVLMMLAMAATYDPDPQRPYGVRLPVDERTCRLDLAAWQRWLAHDPLTLAANPACLAAARSLQLMYVDCGSRDQYFLHYGCRSLADALRAGGVNVRYEEFDDDHSSVDYRLDVSLPLLYEATTAGETPSPHG